MESLLLATNVWNWVLIGVVLLLLIAMPMLMNARNKRETQKVQEQTNSLKVGDKVLTTSGVYGTIVELQFDETKKVVVLETGSAKNKSFLSVDAYAVYTVFKSDAQLAQEAAEREQAEKLKAEQAEAAKAAKKARKHKNEGLLESTLSSQDEVQQTESEIQVQEPEKQNKQKKNKD